MEAYHEFFAASTGAAAAFIGLLFVALSFIDGKSVDDTARSWRRIIASSSFAQLVNIFFVSLIALTPDVRNAAVAGCVLAVAGLVVAVRLLPRTIERERTGRTRPTLLGLVTVGAYGLELVTCARLLSNPNNASLMGYFVLALVILYAGALSRAWEITGLKDSRH